MIDHIGFAVRDFEASRAFYDKVFAPLGYALLMQVTAEMTGGSQHAGYGANGRAQFWIGTGPSIGGPVHIAFEADSRDKVDAFHAAALMAGGRDNGAPGLRTVYHPNYYGAYVFDPDGNNIEAVCHKPA